jgi:hypothetical protein
MGDPHRRSTSTHPTNHFHASDEWLTGKRVSAVGPHCMPIRGLRPRRAAADGERKSPRLRGGGRALDTAHGRYNSFGRSGQIRSQRWCIWGWFRFGQSPRRSDIHLVIFPRRLYCAMSFATLYRPFRWHRAHCMRSTSCSLPAISPKVRLARCPRGRGAGM